MKKEIIKKGDKYNRLTAVRFDHKDKNDQKYWLFKCSCGNEKIIRVSSVKNGAVKSCGCLAKEIEIKRILVKIDSLLNSLINKYEGKRTKIL